MLQKNDRVQVLKGDYRDRTGTLLRFNKLIGDGAWRVSLDLKGRERVNKEVFVTEDDLMLLAAEQPEKEMTALLEAESQGSLEIPVKDIAADPNQPRKVFDQTSLEELADSIRKHKVLQPIVLRPFKGKPGQWMIVFGERRWRASVLAGMDTIPAFIRNISDDEAFELQIVENLQRRDVHPMEEARGFRYLFDHDKSVEDIAGRVGNSTKYVAARLKLTDLIPEFQEAYLMNLMEYSQARLICRQNDETQKILYLDSAKFEEPESSMDDDEDQDNDLFVAQKCRVCGCTDDNCSQCVERTGESCHWVEEDLCSACEGETVVTTLDDRIDATKGLKLTKLSMGNVEWKIGRQERDLSVAPFDITAPDLLLSMGACTDCKYNTANTPELFVSDQRICTNITCFMAKKKQSFVRTLEAHATDPEMLFIYTGWGRPSGEDKEAVDIAREMGLVVLERGDYSMDAPVDPGPMPEWEAFKESWSADYLDGDPFDDEAENQCRNDYDEQVEEWQVEFDEYSKRTNASPRKAFVVAGYQNEGDVINVTLSEKGDVISNLTGDEAASSQAEISEIMTRLERSKEIDQEKIHARVKEALNSCDDYTENNGLLLRCELVGLIIFLFDNVGYTYRQEFVKSMGLQGAYAESIKLFEKLKDRAAEDLQAMSRKLIRMVLLEKLTSDKDNPKKSGKAATIREIAISYLPHEVMKFDEEQAVKAEKRQKNAEKKIEDLKS